ncbi:hypothetical protein PQI23_13285 [Leucobacter sp. USCH14]|uniref:hypothetical protein n=1 Tax=Leucobacter sp. USCH14 TaxID=3024838 RepID=UPI0030A072F2
MSDKDARKLARKLVGIERRLDAGRAKQLPFTAIELDDGTSQGITDGVTAAVDAYSLAGTHDEGLTELSDIADGTAVESTFLPERLGASDGSADAAFELGLIAAGRVDEAHAAADEAVEEALLAKQTADGKNSIYSQPITPVALPDRPFKQSDVWYETQVVDGKTRIATVNVWDGTKWAPNSLVGNSLLVPGSVGNVLIENGAITGVKLSVDALNFKSATGLTLTAATLTGSTIRTSASGQRMEFNQYGIQGFNNLNQVVASMSIDTQGILNLSGANGGVRLSAQFSSFTYQNRLTYISGGNTLVSRREKSVTDHTEAAGWSASGEYGFNLDAFGRIGFQQRFSSDDGSPVGFPSSVALSFQGPKPNGIGSNSRAANVQFSGYDNYLFSNEGGYFQTYGELRASNVQIYAPAGQKSRFWGDVEFGGAVKFQGDTQGDAYLNSAGGISAPYAISGGIVTQRSVAAGGVTRVTVTFPVGRFTVAPRVSVTVFGDARDTTVTVDSVTSDSCVVILGSMSIVARTIGAHWTAIQMTPNSANG